MNLLYKCGKDGGDYEYGKNNIFYIILSFVGLVKGEINKEVGYDF